MQTKIIKNKFVNNENWDLIEFIDDFGKIIKYEVINTHQQKNVKSGTTQPEKIAKFNNKGEAIDYFDGCFDGINRFGFRKFKKIKNIQLNFKILFTDDGTKNSIKLILSSTENIFLDGRIEKGKYYKDFKIYDYEWENISREIDYTKIKNEFRDAEDEFKTINNYSEYKNPVNLYLIEKAIKFLEGLT